MRIYIYIYIYIYYEFFVQITYFLTYVTHSNIYALPRNTFGNRFSKIISLMVSPCSVYLQATQNEIICGDFSFREHENVIRDQIRRF